MDLILALVLALLLTSSTGHWFSMRAVDALGTDDPAGWWKGPAPMLIGMVGSLLYGLPLTVILVTLAELFFGQSPGKALLGLRITNATTSGRWIRLVLRDGPWWLALSALLVATPSFSRAAAGIAGLWAIAAVVAPLLRGRPLHDLPPFTGGVTRPGFDQRA